MTMNIGENINGYIVTKYIGGGGMGNVWKVNKDGVEYAVKISTSPEEEAVSRLNREYRLMKSLNHPNVLKAIEEGVYKGMPYFVME